jgi:hypothetical protein
VTHPPLTLAGGPVALVARLPDGRVRCCYLDRAGARTRHGRDAHAHELRGVGWHLAAIKAAIAALPLVGEPFTPSDLQASSGRPRAWLHAHHTAATED